VCCAGTGAYAQGVFEASLRQFELATSQAALELAELEQVLPLS
jgi:hypothetical protein